MIFPILRHGCATLFVAVLSLMAPALAAAQSPAAAQTEPAAHADLVLPAGADAAGPEAGSIFFVGTATVIVRYGGFTILTDPNFLHKGDHVHLGYGLTARRLTDPALELAQLPPIDFIVLSHFHEDHFDKLVQERLDRDIPIVSTPEASEHLRRLGFRRTFALGKWAAMSVRKGTSRVRVTAMPAHHGPPVLNRALPQTMGSLLEFEPAAGRTAYRMYISGDTLVYKDLREIPKRHSGIDLALLHLGGTRAAGVLVTMDGRQGVEAIRIVNPDLAIPIHYDDYDVFKSPLSDFIKAVKDAGLENKVHVMRRGDTYTFQVPPARLQ
jgi:L-ascorbate metabolism protein UlaG (beta-lactamase superfamily)